jgi:hypothetical protein
LQALSFLSRAGRVDLQRVLVLRTVSNYDREPLICLLWKLLRLGTKWSEILWSVGVSELAQFLKCGNQPDIAWAVAAAFGGVGSR